MNLKKTDLLLYAITDRSWLNGRTLYEQVEEALKGGATILQIREKDLPEAEVEKEAKQIQVLCKKYGVPLIINDNVELAKRIDADGVHVGQSDMEAGKVRAMLGPDKIIGVTAKTVEQARFAEENGADYLGVGAVFHTGTKKDAIGITHDDLEQICASVHIPAVAIGGITRENVEQLKGRGMAGIAVVSAIFGQPDIETATTELKKTVLEMTARKTALTIAGSDCSGGAGIQADMKTMLANGVYAMSAITALTAQNTKEITGIMEVEPEFFEKQLDAVFTDIFPDTVKIGMIPNVEIMKKIIEKLCKYQPENIVIDPVMISSSGTCLMPEDAVTLAKRELFPLAALLTPNIPEAEVLTGIQITTTNDMERAAKEIAEAYGCAVLCKGGHQAGTADDVLCADGVLTWFRSERIENPNTHGTGCTMSSAIAAHLAKGETMEQAVSAAKSYIHGAIAAMLDLGAGSGPLDHGFAIHNEWTR